MEHLQRQAPTPQPPQPHHDPRIVQMPVNPVLPVANQPIYTDEDVKTIKEMFPTFDEDVIKSLLETNNGNKEKTINMLLQMVVD